MKPVLSLMLCLAAGPALMRAGDPPAAAPLPGNPAEHGVPGTNTGLPALGPATAGPAVAGNGAPAPAPVFIITPADSGTSPAMQQLSAALPKYDPEASKSTKPAGTVGTPSPDAIELPKFTVRPRPRPRLAPAAVITNKGLEEKLSPLDTKLLNKFILPGWMGGVSAAERAREEEQQKKKEALTQDVNTLAKAVEATDPAQAKALRDAVAKP